MKNFFKKFAASLLLIHLALTIQMAVAHAGDTPTKIEDTPSVLEYLQLTTKDTNLPAFTDTGQHPDATNVLPGLGTATSPIYFAIDLFRYAISGIALLMIVIAAIKLVSTDAEEKAKEQKQLMVIGVVGLIVIQMADTIVKKMVFGELGDAFEDVGSAQLYGEQSTAQLRGIIGFAHAFLGAAAVLVIVVKAATMIYDPGDEEKIGKEKEAIVYALIGLALVGLSEIIVRGFIFPKNGSALPDVNVARQVVVALTNYLSGFVSLFAFLALIFAGYRYVISAGNDEETEKVKKIFYGAIIALVLALGAFALVNTLLTLDETITTQL